MQQHAPALPMTLSSPLPLKGKSQTKKLFFVTLQSASNNLHFKSLFLNKNPVYTIEYTKQNNFGIIDNFRIIIEYSLQYLRGKGIKRMLVSIIIIKIDCQFNIVILLLLLSVTAFQDRKNRRAVW